VPKDYTEAVKWYRLAADQGYAWGRYDLGIMYAYGQGLPKDDVLAYMWENLAAAQGFSAAGYVRDYIAQHMTPEQIAEAQKLAREWKPTRQPTK